MKLTKRMFTFNEVVIIVLVTFILADTPVWYLANDKGLDELQKTGAGFGQIVGAAIAAIVTSVVREWLDEQRKDDSGVQASDKRDA